MNRLAIVVPCYNEEEMLPITSNELRAFLSKMVEKEKITDNSFILFVNDGSKDRTWELIQQENLMHDEIFGLKLSKNVGHQYALTAGLLFAKEQADMIVSIDADLQDDIHAIEEMIDRFHEGHEIVYGVRKKRTTDTFFKRTTAQFFYRFMKWMGVETIYNHADFRLMSKRAVEYFSEFQETNLFLRGMMPLIGLSSTSVYYDRSERVAGESKYPLKKMIALALEGITSFSIRPITMIFHVGIIITMLSIVAAIYALVSLTTGNVVPGWTSLILSVWFIGGVQLICVGLIGEYIGKIYIEVKHRPRYQIETVLDDKKPE